MRHVAILVCLWGAWLSARVSIAAEVKACEGTITIATYPWEDDVNPKFWALEGGPRLSTTVHGAIIYPYTMQDHLLRDKVERSYKAVFLENEYLKVTCLPELGGRLHSVYDKTEGKEMFHLNRVVKPGMIAMRGAWISGGVEWNSGPHGHTVTVLSPVDVRIGRHPDGSAFLEINNQEKIFRTRWTVRVTLHPGRAYLDERVCIFNPTDGMHPYYSWNCTAFPNRPGTRFIYPMSLGTDHHAREFFSWPIHQGRDLSWLKNHETWASVFAYGCDYDFFGAYDVEADRGIVQVANHHELGGKKAWTWGTWDYGVVAQGHLTDEDGPYIEVQSGPLRTQSDYGMLRPRESTRWREWWYPVHGLGEGFEFATRDLAVQSRRRQGRLTLRLLATGRFPKATCRLSQEGRPPVTRQVDLGPESPATVTLADVGHSPVEVRVTAQGGRVLGSFVTPLPIRQLAPPEVSTLMDRPDAELSLEEKYLKGRKFDRDTNRLKARRYYEMVLAEDSGHVRALRSLAVLDVEAGLYRRAAERLERALRRDPDDGLCWFFLGVCHLRRNEPNEALSCGYRASRCFGTDSLGYDLAGRAYMRIARPSKAAAAFAEAVRRNPYDPRARDHLLLAVYRKGERRRARQMAELQVARDPSDLVARAVLALQGETDRERFVRDVRGSVGEIEFEMLETSLVFAELGLTAEAVRLLRTVCVDNVPEHRLGPLPLYYAGYYAWQSGDEPAAKEYLGRAAGIHKDFVFPSRPQAVEVLEFAVQRDPDDARAHLHLGNLYGNLGRLDEAVGHWERAAGLDPSLSIALRNLALAASAQRHDLRRAAALYRRAIAARPTDQTLYRDLAEILIADGKRPEAIDLMAKMPYEKMRRADITVMLAQAYLDEGRYTECIDLLESTPYFINWEGQRITWTLFSRAHMERGRRRLEDRDFRGALVDFEAALTYPENLGVGRPNKPEESQAQYFRGKALRGLGRVEEARAAWKQGAEAPQGSARQNEFRRRCREALEDLASRYLLPGRLKPSAPRAPTWSRATDGSGGLAP